MPATTTIVRSTAVTAVLGAICLAGFGALAEGAPGHATNDPVRDPAARLTPAQRHVIRAATVRFRDPAAAVAAGYVPTDECVDDPVLGGMGFHYVQPELMDDMTVDPTLPETLVYAPAPGGERRLVAIEYVKNDADGDLGTDGDRPSLFGQPFDGPMPGHVPGQPVHYDIHAWVFKDNPAGQLAQFNPRVSCEQR